MESVSADKASRAVMGLTIAFGKALGLTAESNLCYHIGVSKDGDGHFLLVRTDRPLNDSEEAAKPLTQDEIRVKYVVNPHISRTVATRAPQNV